MPTKLSRTTTHATQTAPASRPTRPTRTSGKQLQRRRTLTKLVDEYLMIHRSEAHSPKTIEWHSTALGLLLRFLDEEGVTLPHEFETSHLRAWVVWLSSPESVVRRPNRQGGTVRSKRTVHTYTRSAHVFCKWLLEEGYTEVDVTDHFTLPKLGKPLIKILEEDDFRRLLDACEQGQHPREYALRNQAILWTLYDTGIRISELANLTFDQINLREGLLIAHGKGDKERRIAFGSNAVAALRRYLDHARPSFRGSDTSKRVFLGEQGELTRRGVDEMIARLRRRCGFTDRRVSAHIFRHTFAVRYLMLGGDPFTLQQLLGHEDMETIRNYMHLNDIHIQTQKRRFSPGDHVSFSVKPQRRRGFREK